MKDTTNTKILVCGDSLNQTTGFSSVISSIIKRLYATGRYEISYATLTGVDTTTEGLNAQGEDFAECMKHMPITNIQVTDQNNAQRLEHLLETTAPHIVLTSHDPWHVDTIAYSRYRDSFYWAAYMTVEVPRYPHFVMSPSTVLRSNKKPIRDIISRADVVIPHTQMGHDMLTDQWQLCNVSEPCFSGVDFDKRCIETISKKEAFGDSVAEDDFIFMSMGINSERKKLDRVIEAFYKFKCKQKSNRYKLYLHTDIHAQTGGTDLYTMVRELGLLDDILIPTAYHAGIGIPKHELYKKYKASDCYIGLPAGEGMGNGFTESMMHGKPVIYTNYGGHTCYCTPAGIGVKVKEYTHARYAFMKWALADTGDAARAMERMVSDTAFREHAGQKGFEIARDILNWDTIFPQFENLLLSQYASANQTALLGTPMRRIV